MKTYLINFWDHHQLKAIAVIIGIALIYVLLAVATTPITHFN